MTFKLFILAETLIKDSGGGLSRNITNTLEICNFPHALLGKHTMNY